MNGLFTLFKLRTRALFHYKTAAFAGICTQLFWGLLLTMILKAFYAQNPHQPLPLSNALTFIWFGQALLQLLPWSIDKEIETSIRSGDVLYELLRPLHLYWLWFARCLALRSAPTLLRALPIFLLAEPLGLSAPHSPLFLLSLPGALLLSTALTELITISLFWTLSGEGLQRLLPHLTVLLSGMLVPLPLFPQALQPFLLWQPFRGVMDIPCRLYTGMISSADAPFYLLFQLGWALLFILLGKHLLHRALKKLVIQGG